MTTRHIESKSRNNKRQQRLKTAGNDRKNCNNLNHIVDSQAARIDNCLYAGNKTLSEIKAYSGAATTARVKNHFRHLSDDHDLLVIIENDKCKFAV